MGTRSNALGLPVRRAQRAERIRQGRLRPGHPSVLITVTSASLVMLGLIMVLSASSVASFANYGSSFLFFNKQLLWAGIGVVAFIAFARLDYRALRGLGYVGVVVSVCLLVIVIVPGVGITVGGSARWLSLGPFAFQPSEVAKLGLVLFAADVFSRKRENTFDSFSHTAVPLLPVFGLLAVLIMLQPDLGTTFLLGVIALGMLFVAGAPFRYIIPIVAGGLGVAMIAAIAEPYRRARLLAFMNPWSDPFNTGYQTIQSLIAMGSGGWFGVGLGASRQKWLYVPNAHTDFIYAIFGEEAGFFGTIVVLGLFAFLAYLGIRTARKAPDRFGMLVASGITLWIAVQALINMGAVTASLPITGVPLPLVSFGGTSLLISLAAMGILTNIAWQGSRSASFSSPRSREVRTRAGRRPRTQMEAPSSGTRSRSAPPRRRRNDGT